VIKVIKDILLLVFLFIAASNISKAEEGGVKLENGCYTLVIVTDGDHGRKIITVQDCRGGRKI
jgi:hypothetical protein